MVAVRDMLTSVSQLELPALRANTLFFSVPGPPRGKGRPRAVRRGNFIAMHSDPETAVYENKVAMCARAAMNGRPLLEGPLELRLLIRMPIPKSASERLKNKMRDGVERPTKKPDASNVQKAIEDGLNGVVWKDDTQVTTTWARKIYSDTPGVDVQVRPDSAP